MKQFSPGFTTLLVIVVFSFITSCKEDDPVPLQAEVKAVLLAGDAGSSKTWKLVTITEKEGTGTEQTYNLGGCAMDNIYKFSNNASQDYEESEGATKCNASDAAIVEKGTWAFTLDGTILVLLNNIFDSGSSAFSFTQYFPFPGEVVELSDSILKIKMTYTIDGIIIVNTFTFNKN